MQQPSALTDGFANSFLTITVAFGVVGLVAFLAVLGAVAVAGLGYLRTPGTPRSIGVALLSLVACIVTGAVALWA